MTVSTQPDQPKRVRNVRDEAVGPRPEDVEASGVLDSLPEDPNAMDRRRGSLGRGSSMGKQDNEMLSPWQRVESLFRLASLVAISASAVLAAVQFYNGRADARKEQSVALINAWQANDARKAYATLRQEIEDAVETAGPIPANIPDEAQEQIKYNIGTALIQRWGEDEGRDADTMTANIEAVINFYTEIHFCIQANLCDESLLMQYFADEVTSFWDYFEPYAEMRRQGFYPNYGIAVERLVAHIDM